MKKILTFASFIRAFLLCLLLLGSQLSIFADLFASAQAVGYPHGRSMHHSLAQPHLGMTRSQLRTTKSSPEATPRTVMKAVVPDRHTPHARPTARATPAAPDVLIVKTSSGSSFRVGQTVTYTLRVSTALDSGIITAGTAIRVSDALPLGFDNVTVTSGSDWLANCTATTSPSLVEAYYHGMYPIAPGTMLGTITITGKLNANAVSPLPNSATVVVNGNVHPDPTSFVTITLGLAPRDVGTPTPTPTNTPTPTPAPPDVGILKLAAGSTFHVGDTVTYTLTVGTALDSGTIEASRPIVVTDGLPAGFNNVTATGSDWSISGATDPSPSLILATYTGTYPIAPGTTLGSITITGVLNSDALSPLTNTANLIVTGNVNPDPTSGVTITIEAEPTPTPTPTPTPALTEAPTPTPTPTETPTSAPPDMGITKTASGSTFHIGDTVTVLQPGPVTGTPVATVTVVTAPSPTVVATGTAVSAPTVSPSPTETAVATNTLSATETAVATNTPSATETPVNPPDLQIIGSSLKGDQYEVGDKVTFFLTITNQSNAGPVTDPTTITLKGVIPVGFTHIKVHGENWQFSVSDITSPAVIEATYTGTDPLKANQTLPVITISGVLTEEAVPSLTYTASVDVPGEPDMDNNSMTYTIYAQSGDHHNNNNHHNNNEINNDHSNNEVNDNHSNHKPNNDHENNEVNDDHGNHEPNNDHENNEANDDHGQHEPNNGHENNNEVNDDHGNHKPNNDHENNNEVNNNNNSNNDSENFNVRHENKHHQQHHHNYPGLPLTGSDPGMR